MARSTFYESRFLVLGQQLPGQESKGRDSKQKRIYRPGVEPKVEEDDETDLIFGHREDWTGTGQEDWDDVGEEERHIAEPKVLEEDGEKTPEPDEPPQPVDLSTLDLNSLQVPEAAEEIDEDEEAETRRARAKAKAILNKDKPKAPVQIENQPFVKVRNNLKKRVKVIRIEEEVTDSSSDEADSESSSDDSDIGTRGGRLKIEYKSKKLRNKENFETFAEAEERLMKDDKKLRKKMETARIKAELVEYVRTNEVGNDDSGNEEMPDDDDDVDQDEQFKLWKKRELLRMKRVQDELDAHELEKEEIAKRRLMSDDDIKRLDGAQPIKLRTQMKFLQKYFHKGAFFNDEDNEEVNRKLLERNFNSAVGKDKWTNFDDEALPEVLKVKNFGLASRTKYTHLADQDTTIKDGQFRSYEIERVPLNTSKVKLGGLGSVARPRGRKRKRDTV